MSRWKSCFRILCCRANRANGLPEFVHFTYMENIGNSDYYNSLRTNVSLGAPPRCPFTHVSSIKHPGSTWRNRDSLHGYMYGIGTEYEVSCEHYSVDGNLMRTAAGGLMASLLSFL